MSRNAQQWPFAAASPWNTPIGSGAVYVNVNMPTYGPNGSGNFTGMPWIDPEHIVQDPSGPTVTIAYSSAGWSGSSRCSATGGSSGGLPVTVPVPATYTVPSDNTNSCASFLQSDGRTITQTQPLALCTAGGNGTSLVAFANVDLHGQGITGSHGGSGLSAVGGSIRMGELRPGQIGMRHALKFAVDGLGVLAPQTSLANSYRWPAVTADSDWSGYGSNNPTQYSGMKMGALLAIPASVNINSMGLVSAPGLQLAWTLQNYGIYIVDTGDTEYFLDVEDSPAGSKNAEFLSDWGYSLEGRIADNTPWTNDFQTCMGALWLVDNNSASTVGGGGVPLQPYAPLIGTPVQQLADPFTGASLNTGLWTQTTGGSTTMSYAGTGATVTLPSSATSSDSGKLTSVAAYDLTEGSAFLQAVSVPSASTHAFAVLQLLDSLSGNYLQWQVEAGSLVASYSNGSSTTVATVTYSATAHRWWRIRESAGTTYWDTSPDGFAWTNRGSVLDSTHDVTIADLDVVIQAACFQAETNPGTFTFLDFNTAPTPLFSAVARVSPTWQEQFRPFRKLQVPVLIPPPFTVTDSDSVTGTDAGAPVIPPGVFFDAVGPSSSGSSTSSYSAPVTWTHTPAGTPTAVLVGLAVGSSADGGITASVTYGGVSMTSLAREESGTGAVGYSQLFALAAPPPGAQTVQVTLAGGSGATLAAGSLTYTGTGTTQATAFGAVAVATSAPSVTSGSVTLTGTGSLNMVACVVADGSGGEAASSDTLRWKTDIGTASAAGNGAAFDKSSAAGSVTVSWTQASDSYGAVAVELLVPPPPPPPPALSARVPGTWRERFQPKRKMEATAWYPPQVTTFAVADADASGAAVDAGESVVNLVSVADADASGPETDGGESAVNQGSVTTVTAAQSGTTYNGMLLRVRTVVNCLPAASQPIGKSLNTSLAVTETPTTAGSMRFVAATESGTSSTVGAQSGTTLFDASGDSTDSVARYTGKATSLTPSPPVSETVGWSASTSACCAVVEEILAAGSIADSGTAPGAAHTESAATVTTASFALTPGTVLVAMLSSHWGTGATMTVSDATGLQWILTKQTASTGGSAYAGIFIAQVPYTDFDVGRGTDGGESIRLFVSSSDAVSGTDASAPVVVLGPDTCTGADSGGTAATLAASDSVVGTDIESLLPSVDFSWETDAGESVVVMSAPAASFRPSRTWRSRFRQQLGDSVVPAYPGFSLPVVASSDSCSGLDWPGAAGVFVTSAQYGFYNATGSDGNAYYWNNDMWGPDTGPQYLWVDGNNAWGVVSSQPAGQGVETFPHIGYASGANLSTFKQITGYSTESNPGYAGNLFWEAAYDIWLNNGGHPGQDSGYEVMIWTDVANVSLGGSVLATPTIGGVTYNFYQGTGGNGPQSTFIRQSNATAAVTDVKGCIAYVAAYGGNYTGPADPEVDTIEFGFEIWGTPGPEQWSVSQFSLFLGATDSESSGPETDAGESIAVALADTDAGHGTDAGEGTVRAGFNIGQALVSATWLTRWGRQRFPKPLPAFFPQASVAVTDTDSVTGTDSGLVLQAADSGHGEDSGFTVAGDADAEASADSGTLVGLAGAEASGPAADLELTAWPHDSDASGRAAEFFWWSGPLADSDASGPAADQCAPAAPDTDACLGTDSHVVEVYTFQPPFRFQGGGYRLVLEVRHADPEIDVLRELELWSGTRPEGTAFRLAAAHAAGKLRFVSCQDRGSGCEQGEEAASLQVAVHVTAAVAVQLFGDNNGRGEA